MLEQCLFESGLPLVIDADGLNLLASQIADEGGAFLTKFIGQREQQPERNIILTPHLGEFSRLYGCSVSEASGNLTVWPKELAERLHCIVVCKDARTIVACSRKEQVYINTSGNAGMATAGSGDVLAGMITGLLAQGMNAEEVAEYGVFLHGIAGDMAAGVYGERSMTATDIIEQFPRVFRFVEEGDKERCR